MEGAAKQAQASVGVADAEESMVLNLCKHTQSSSSRELGGWCQHQAVTQPKSVQQLSVRKTTFWGSAISVRVFKQGKTCSV